MIIAFKEFKFCAAHNLLIEGHPCSEIHGHNYKLRIEVEGEPDKDTGMIMDFDDMKKIVNPIIDKFDHTYLNNWIDITTSENIAFWFFQTLIKDIPNLYRIELRETDTCGAIWQRS